MADGPPSRTAAVVGVGPGLGRGVAEALAADGFAVGIFARSRARIEEMAAETGPNCRAYHMDATDEASVRRALDAFRNDTKNHIDVLVYNCGARRLRPYGVEETSVETFKRFWEINCFGAFLCARNVFADMKKNGGGCIIFTGATASVRGSAGRSDFSPGKFGLRSLAQTLNAEGTAHNIHVVHVIIDGPVDMPLVRSATGRTSDQLISPDRVGELYCHLVNQPPTCWTSEVDVHIPAKL